jgi:purine-nucleoside phosphorylase
MTPFPHLDKNLLEQAAVALRERFPDAEPKAGLILGSGWSAGLSHFKELDACSADEIPGLGISTVPGHQGRIVLADCHGIQTLIFQGRRHWYEGVGWLPVILPIYLMKSMVVQHIVLTNAAGGLRKDLEPGCVVLIRDHLNLMGAHPLQGPHQPLLGLRFPDLSNVYSPELAKLVRKAAGKIDLPLHEGVYAALSGPSYETPAEVRMLMGLGADLVGMSTVPEAIVAAACGLNVAALSCVTNKGAGLSEKPLSHVEVLETLQAAGDRLGRLLAAIWEQMAKVRPVTGSPL